MRWNQSILKGNNLIHRSALVSNNHAGLVINFSQPMAHLSVASYSFLSTLWCLCPLIRGRERGRVIGIFIEISSASGMNPSKERSSSSSFELNARRSEQRQPSPFSDIVQLSPFQIRTQWLTFLGRVVSPLPRLVRDMGKLCGLNRK